MKKSLKTSCLLERRRPLKNCSTAEPITDTFNRQLIYQVALSAISLLSLDRIHSFFPSQFKSGLLRAKKIMS